MSANTINRETIRGAFSAILSTALTGSGKPVQAVYKYPKGIIEETPVVCVASSGTARQRAGIGDARWNSYVKLEIGVWVRDADTSNGWTEEEVEDTLDLIDKMIADAVADNRVNANWQNISYNVDPAGTPEFSQIFTDTERGYKLEVSNVYIQRIDS